VPGRDGPKGMMGEQGRPGARVSCYLDDDTNIF